MTALQPDRHARADHRFFVGMWLSLDPDCLAAQEYRAAYLALEAQRPELEAQRIEIMAGQVRKIGERVADKEQSMA